MTTPARGGVRQGDVDVSKDLAAQWAALADAREQAWRAERALRVIEAAKAFIANPTREGVKELANAVGAWRLAEGE